MVVRLTKTVGTLAILILVFVYIQYRAPFVTVSPDSIRFMHLWQASVDQARRAGGNPVIDAVRAIRESLVCNRPTDDVHPRSGPVITVTVRQATAA